MGMKPACEKDKECMCERLVGTVGNGSLLGTDASCIMPVRSKLYDAVCVGLVHSCARRTRVLTTHTARTVLNQLSIMPLSYDVSALIAMHSLRIVHWGKLQLYSQTHK